MAKEELYNAVTTVHDATDATEDDPQSKLTVTATKVAIASGWDSRQAGASYETHVTEDIGLAFGASGEKLIQGKTTVDSKAINGSIIEHGVADRNDEIQNIDDAGGDYITCAFYNYESGGTYRNFILYVCDAGSVSQDGFGISTDWVLSTPYWWEIRFDPNVGANGTVYAFQYSDSARETIVNSKSVALGSAFDLDFLTWLSGKHDFGVPSTCDGDIEDIQTVDVDDSVYTFYDEAGKVIRSQYGVDVNGNYVNDTEDSWLVRDRTYDNSANWKLRYKVNIRTPEGTEAAAHGAMYGVNHHHDTPGTHFDLNTAGAQRSETHHRWFGSGTMTYHVQHTIREHTGAAAYLDSTPDDGTFVEDQDIYMEFEFDPAVGTYGTIYAYLYSDAARTTLLDTLSVALHNAHANYDKFQPWNSQGVAAGTGETWITAEDFQFSPFDPEVLVGGGLSDGQVLME